ncbi:hypothetical protein A3Q56_05010 [Intoshia linei]|uniref:Uncharacterized protein n=1 Tax=Intoshia linei TaxID=1819745 RepID=A0A177B0V4_9BILA|nr:hypothetical protein A3Q56_05010 [Intoshia linei]
MTLFVKSLLSSSKDDLPVGVSTSNGNEAIKIASLSALQGSLSIGWITPSNVQSNISKYINPVLVSKRNRFNQTPDEIKLKFNSVLNNVYDKGNISSYSKQHSTCKNTDTVSNSIGNKHNSCFSSRLNYFKQLCSKIMPEKVYNRQCKRNYLISSNPSFDIHNTHSINNQINSNVSNLEHTVKYKQTYLETDAGHLKHESKPVKRMYNFKDHSNSLSVPDLTTVGTKNHINSSLDDNTFVDIKNIVPIKQNPWYTRDKAIKAKMFTSNSEITKISRNFNVRTKENIKDNCDTLKKSAQIHVALEKKRTVKIIEKSENTHKTTIPDILVEQNIVNILETNKSVLNETNCKPSQMNDFPIWPFIKKVSQNSEKETPKPIKTKKTVKIEKNTLKMEKMTKVLEIALLKDKKSQHLTIANFNEMNGSKEMKPPDNVSIIPKFDDSLTITPIVKSHIASNYDTTYETKDINDINTNPVLNNASLHRQDDETEPMTVSNLSITKKELQKNENILINVDLPMMTIINNNNESKVEKIFREKCNLSDTSSNNKDRINDGFVGKIRKRFTSLSHKIHHQNNKKFFKYKCESEPMDIKCVQDAKVLDVVSIDKKILLTDKKHACYKYIKKIEQEQDVGFNFNNNSSNKKGRKSVLPTKSNNRTAPNPPTRPNLSCKDTPLENLHEKLNKCIKLQISKVEELKNVKPNNLNRYDGTETVNIKIQKEFISESIDCAPCKGDTYEKKIENCKVLSNNSEIDNIMHHNEKNMVELEQEKENSQTELESSNEKVSISCIMDEDKNSFLDLESWKHYTFTPTYEETPKKSKLSSFVMRPASNIIRDKDERNSYSSKMSTITETLGNCNVNISPEHLHTRNFIKEFLDKLRREEGDSDIDSDDYEFVGAGVIVDDGLFKKKRTTNRLSFSEARPTVYEYPSEQCLLDTYFDTFDNGETDDAHEPVNETEGEACTLDNYISKYQPVYTLGSYGIVDSQIQSKPNSENANLGQSLLQSKDSTKKDTEESKKPYVDYIQNDFSFSADILF